MELVRFTPVADRRWRGKMREWHKAGVLCEARGKTRE
jgi:hypothetical protein